jgi:glycosyltransferase involved in cell wall biosynthesis
MVTIIIPAKNEIYLQKTIDDLLLKARGEIEIIPVLDGYWPNPPLKDDNRVRILHRGKGRGMRAAINDGAAIARGEYLMKCDAHCMFDEGFDVKLIKDYQENWIVIPRRLRLDAENWCIEESSKHKPPIDYEYLGSPGHYGAKGNKWDQRTVERMDNPKYLIDETLSFQGSCWFMSKDHFDNFLHGMSEEGYGSFVREAQEIGLKTWLGGGKVMVNKKTWYAHLHKGPKLGRMYFIDKRGMERGNAYCDDFWFNNRWTEAKHDMAWLIERFMPVPSWTPELIETVRKK